MTTRIVAPYLKIGDGIRHVGTTMILIRSKKRVTDHGEVFTPPWMVARMLDLVKAEAEKTASRFLDPACGNGNFLVEILERKLAASEHEGTLVGKHALRALESIHGIEILEDNVAECRLRLLDTFSQRLTITECHELLATASRVVSANIVHGDTLTMKTVDGHDIGFRDWNLHEFVEPRQKDDDLSDPSSSVAANTCNEPATGCPKGFDVIVGNPPYQRDYGGHGASSIQIYDKFIRQAKALTPRFMTMIAPSRWLFGGRAMNAFRKEMLSDNRLRVLVDYGDSRQVFRGVDIAGGISYFLWDRDEPGRCHVVEIDQSGGSTESIRNLLEQDMDVFVRNEITIKILKKIAAIENQSETMTIPVEKRFERQVSSQNPFGLRTYFRGAEERSPEKELFVVRSGGHGWAGRDEVTARHDLIDKWKVFTSKSSADHAGQGDRNGQRRVLSLSGVIPPGAVVTETYVLLGAYDREEEARNCFSYATTKFFRFLIIAKSSSQDLPRKAYSFIPLQDFSKPWSDEELYAKYGLENDEIAWIERSIKPMKPSVQMSIVSTVTPLDPFRFDGTEDDAISLQDPASEIQKSMEVVSA